jgi:hypoxia up-regulated 1
MILTKAKEYAESFALQQVTECVITVPAFFNQAERRAMLKAAELAGIKGMQNILNFGSFNVI